MFIKLLLQVVYITVPILIYYALIRNNASLKRYHSILLGIICGISILLCMSFPISFETGYIMDLRTVPWMISFLYGNISTGIILTIIMLGYRIFLGGIGMFVVFIAYSITLLMILFYFKKYSQFSFQHKMKSVLTLTFINSLLIVSSIHFIFGFSESHYLLFYTVFTFMQLLLTWLTVYMIETFRENDRLQLEMQNSEKLYIVGQMAASVAHEIRNPMTVVSGFMQLLYQSDEIPLKHKEHVKIMTVELERAQAIINDYLTLAKPQADKMEKIDVKEQTSLISQTLSSYALMNGVDLHYHIKSDENFYTFGNPEKMQQVLVNMIKNAIEATLNKKAVTISLSKDNEYIYIDITDQGVGLSEDEIKKIGTPFYSTKEKGTGLGLSVSFSIIRAMNGQIMTTSDMGKGTTFTIKLPQY
ncbi:sensor histidine kinase [Halalkalibacter nanhaiisediminis]|uniref:histidine kinase n=1 Tax=Halalkalibacter nanhaiisediminis TaxID=688079 RepID=A0A562QRN1_9BACI|nr:HAMP domain-containing sensor histidine kinase [Halalkalibacter nanhaiisediminis]TWI59333.1 two-component system sporulation sensor kinase B [Halalkalibacter nanhaiisediminis]